MTLETTSQYCFTYKTDESATADRLLIELLGGVRIDGLDRMRVTVKVEYKAHVIRHNLDLYNEASVDSLVRRCAERFSLGTAYVSQIITALVNALEEYRLKQLDKPKTRKEKAITKEEREEAIRFLG